MILTSPSSRNHRNQLTWTSGQHTKNHSNHHHPNHNHNHNQSSLNQYGSLKRAPPAQQPPKPPSTPASNGSHATVNRSHTLNRFDLQQRRQQAQTQSLRSPLLISREHLLANGYQVRRQPKHQDIYAPASIASPAELAHYKRPNVTEVGTPMQPHVPASQSPLTRANGLESSRHYAATSYRDPPRSAFSESGRCESALGNLLERFGSLRKRSTWSKLTSRRSSSTVPHTQTSNYYGSSFNQQRTRSPGSVLQTDLDEIYAGTSGSVKSMGQKKKPAEAEEIYAEGLRAIDGNGQRRLIEDQLNESIMIEGETRYLIVEESKQQPEYQLLVNQLTNWINDELAQQRIVVRDLQEDLYDGQILGKLIEKLHQLKLDLVEVTQNELTQKYKLKMVLDTINRILSIQARWARIRWTVEGIHSKNMVEIVQLLVTLSLHYRAPIQLPADVHVQVLVVSKNQGLLVRHIQQAQLTCKHEAELSASVARGHQSKLLHLADQTKDGYNSINHQQPSRDAFDILCEFNPDKLTIVKQSLVNFVNRHLNKINMSCLADCVQDVLDPEQFSDGLLLVFLMASLEDYFVPLGNLFTCAPPSSEEPSMLGNSSINLSNNNSGLSNIVGLKTALEPTSYTNTQPIHKLHNVNVAIQLMDEAGIDIKQRVRAEDIVNGDLKSILRVLYALFSRYKHL